MTGKAAYSVARSAPSFLADYAATASQKTFTAGRDTAPSGESAHNNNS
ncbi:hypothetical protein SAMN06298226_0355 [Nitrosovibrio sp. Nv4]|nr:hypothetical protein SAMN06298226_0355 [Nitrosovibrio sp. Nv4]